ncbi:MAG: ATP-binding cassette domain-containing protein, partial [Burkholderiales bacterium]
MKRLEVRDLTVEFGSRRVVDRVSFSIDAGERMALVGESGSGKTVTALSLLRLIEAARLSGGILFEGRNVLAMSEAELHQLRGRDIAVIFQEPMTALNPVFTVGDQIAESLQLHEGMSRQQA